MLAIILVIAILATLFIVPANAAAQAFDSQPVVNVNFSSGNGDQTGNLSYSGNTSTGHKYIGNVALGNQFAIELRGVFGAGVPLYHGAYQIEAYSNGMIESWWSATANPHVVYNGMNMAAEHHVVVVGDVNTFKMYIDGNLAASQTGVSISNSWLLCGDDNSMYVGHGMSSIKSFKVYADAPTADEVKGMYQGLVAATPTPKPAPTPTLPPEPAEGDDYTLIASNVAPFAATDKVTVRLTVSGIADGTSILGFDWEIPYDATLLKPEIASFTSSCADINAEDSDLAWEMIVRQESDSVVVTLLDDGAAMKGISQNNKLWVDLVFTALDAGTTGEELLYTSFVAGTLGGNTIGMAYGKGVEVKVGTKVEVTPTPVPTATSKPTATPVPTPTPTPTPKPVPTLPTGDYFTITTEDVPAFKAGDTVEVTFTINDVPEELYLLTIDLDFWFDETILSPVKESFRSTCEELNAATPEDDAWEMLSRTGENGFIYVGFMEDSDNWLGSNQSGVISATLVFTALKDSTPGEILVYSTCCEAMTIDFEDGYGNGMIAYAKEAVSDPFALIATSKYVKDDETLIINGITPETTVAAFLSNFENQNLRVYKKGVELSGTDIVGTGTVITDGDKEYTVVQIGDINGDGRVAAADYMLIKRIILGNTVTEAQLIAADVDVSGSIAASDYMKVKRYISGGYQLY